MDTHLSIAIIFEILKN